MGSVSKSCLPRLSEELVKTVTSICQSVSKIVPKEPNVLQN
jgi:hypothetical protein